MPPSAKEMGGVHKSFKRNLGKTDKYPRTIITLFPEKAGKSRRKPMKNSRSIRLAILFTLVFTLALRADLAITGTGVVSIGGSCTLHFDGGPLKLENGAHLKIRAGGTLTGPTVEVGSAATLVNCGTVNASVTNAGEVVSNCGLQSVFLGNVTNNGVFRISHGSTLIALGAFQNSPGALLDLITATQTGPPAALTGSGTVMEASDVRIESVKAGAADATIVIQGIPPHTYQLMGTSELSPSIWAPIGPPKIAVGGLLQWEHPGVVTSFDRFFYRVIVGDP